VAEDGQLTVNNPEFFEILPNSMNPAPLRKQDLQIPARGTAVWAIEIVPEQIITKKVRSGGSVRNGLAVSDPLKDISKIAVIERHHATDRIGLGFVKGFGLQRGALAATVAHDSHNIIVVGSNDSDPLVAFNKLTEMHGGQVVIDDGEILASLPLPVAGLLNAQSMFQIRLVSDHLNQATRALKCNVPNPFMTLSLLALPVIPEIKLTDRGLVDVGRLELIDLFTD
jgi:adenine deaminase